MGFKDKGVLMVGLNYDGSKTSFSMLQCYKLTSLNLDCRNISVHTLVGFLKPFFFKEDLKPYSPGPTSEMPLSTQAMHEEMTLTA